MDNVDSEAGVGDHVVAKIFDAGAEESDAVIFDKFEVGVDVGSIYAKAILIRSVGDGSWASSLKINALSTL